MLAAKIRNKKETAKVFINFFKKSANVLIKDK